MAAKKEPMWIEENAIVKRSALLKIVDHDGKPHTGYCQKYKHPQPHINRKKGELHFYTEENVTIPNVKSFNDIVL